MGFIFVCLAVLILIILSATIVAGTFIYKQYIKGKNLDSYTNSLAGNLSLSIFLVFILGAIGVFSNARYNNQIWNDPLIEFLAQYFNVILLIGTTLGITALFKKDKNKINAIISLYLYSLFFIFECLALTLSGLR